ncbi:hypothetical protein QVZ41_14495 [Wenyingzhuangia sp. chi5]|uniref:Outer membrane protein beta-barrel domain-containing protein n=1 Tax=Wenyingzhuangia gilva TaxID=3057677 RepID=A0ABT8VVR2_9FLAO|nr:hypothetical protein [Wenyingzhuangia sp. chi5]MDO3696059.1 hypothetical protein [Wenyingzhuangia sp. chi5]
MKKIILFLFIISYFNSYCQKNNSNIFIELGGNAITYSVNYEKIIKQIKNHNLAIRIGGSYFKKKGQNNIIGIPIGVNLITNNNKNHHLDLGAGVSYSKGFIQSGTVNNNEWDSYEELFFIPSIGYRYDKLKKGINFRIAYTPLISIKILDDIDRVISENFKYSHFGIMVGYRF